MKAVIDGVLQHVSVSQIQTFDAETFGGCERKWWFDKVSDLPRAPDAKYQLLGKAVHKEIEHYLLTGEDVLGSLARAGKHFLPQPKVWLLVEHEAKGLTAAGVPVIAYIDVVNYSGDYVDTDGRQWTDDTLEIIDWKTTSDIKYAKTASELRATVQMVGYAAWGRTRDWDVRTDRVRLSHGVFVTRGAPYALKTTTTIGADEITTRWNRAETVVERMKLVAGAPTLDEVEPNFRACAAYGGCTYASVCPRTVAQKISFLGGNDMGTSLLNRLMKSAAPVANATPNVSPEIFAKLSKDAQLASLFPQDSSGIVAAEVAKLEAEERAAKGQPEPNVTVTRREHGADAVAAITGDRNDQAVTVSAKMARAVGVVPPDAPVSAPPTSAEPIPAETLLGMHPAIQAAAQAFVAEGASVEVKPADVGPGEGDGGGGTMVVTAEKPKRGRPKKAPPTTAERDAIGSALDAAAKTGADGVIVDETTNPPTAAPVGAHIGTPATDAERVAVGLAPVGEGIIDKTIRDSIRGALDDELADSLAKVDAAKMTFDTAVDILASHYNLSCKYVGDLLSAPATTSLFVDVVMSGIRVTDLEPYIVSKCRALEAQFKAADVRCAPEQGPLGFGKWRGALAAVVRAEPPAPGVYSLHDVKGSEIREVVVEALRPLCAAYVRGR